MSHHIASQHRQRITPNIRLQHDTGPTYRFEEIAAIIQQCRLSGRVFSSIHQCCSVSQCDGSLDSPLCFSTPPVLAIWANMQARRSMVKDHDAAMGRDGDRAASASAMSASSSRPAITLRCFSCRPSSQRTRYRPFKLHEESFDSNGFLRSAK